MIKCRKIISPFWRKKTRIKKNYVEKKLSFLEKKLGEARKKMDLITTIT
jgi:hypothetical protein